MKLKLPHLLLLAALLAALYFFFRDNEQTDQHFQGYIEGKLVLVGPEQGGLMDHQGVLEGAQVKKGEPLFSLDRQLAEAKLAETKAGLEKARATLANLQAPQQRPAEISVLQAARNRAKAAYELARLEVRRIRPLVRKNVSSQERLDRANAELAQMKAAYQEIDAKIAVARLPARRQLIEAAKAAVEAARKAHLQAQLLLQKRKISAPVSGTVQQIFFRKGEVVAAGQPVLSLLPPSNLRALFFVAERFRSKLAKGQKVAISCDGCASGLSGRISFIAQNAEFTPPIIYGPSERAKLVFRIEATLDKKAQKLSPGQPVSIIPLSSDNAPS